MRRRPPPGGTSVCGSCGNAPSRSGGQLEIVSRGSGGHHGPPAAPSTGEESDDMVMGYTGPDRRRGGPDRRNPDARVRILLVDDHALFRLGMRQTLEQEPDFDIVAEADDSAVGVRGRGAARPRHRAPRPVHPGTRWHRDHPAHQARGTQRGHHRPRRRRGRGHAVRRHQGGRRGVHPQGHRAGRPGDHHPARQHRRVPHQ